MTSNIFLLAINLIIWFLPTYCYKNFSRITILLTCFIFSSSYWIYIALSDILGRTYSVVIIDNYVPEALVYSAWAGLSLHISLLLFCPRNIRANLGIAKKTLDSIFNFPGSNLATSIKLILLLFLLYALYNAILSIGVGGRIYFTDEVSPFWQTTLLRISSFLLFILFIFDNKKYQSRICVSTFITIALAYFHFFLVGFDGGRRESLLPVLGYALCIIKTLTEDEHAPIKFHLINILIMGLFIGALSFNRSFDVGWTYFFSYDFDLRRVLETSLYGIFSPMPTIHVSTRMIEYIQANGTQGYESYFTGILNTIFPRFLFGDYLFGTPLSTKLATELGWHGLDFGFLAEGIYAGGYAGVFITHFIFGCVLSFILRGIQKGSKLAFCLAIGISFGLLNSLRSDFMNLLKSTLYVSIFIYVLINFSRLKIGRKHKKVLVQSQHINSP